MQFKRFGLMLAAATFAAGAFADVYNTLISFSTEGDTYADGVTPVLQGEWYALCWSADGNFDGITNECQPADSNDKIVRVGAFAEELPNGKVGCPLVIFQLKPEEAKPLENGQFCIYLLDTRNAAGTGVAAKASDRIGPAEIHGATASATADVKSSGSGIISDVESQAVESAEWVASVVGEDGEEATIEKIVPVSEGVRFTVSGLRPGVKYNIKAGNSPTTLTEWVLNVPLTVGSETTFTIDPEDARFFSIDRNPLTK